MGNSFGVTCTILAFVFGFFGIILLWRIIILLKELLNAVDQQRSAIVTEIKGLADLMESRSRARTREDKFSSEKYLGAQEKDRGPKL